MSAVFAVLAIVAGLGVLVAVVLSVGGRFVPAIERARDSVSDSLAGWELWLAAAVAITATLGSLYYSEIANFEPCRLCWFQRIAMYPLALILPVAAFRKDRAAWLYAGPLAAIGAVIAAYHYTIQRWPSLDSGGCSIDVPCSSAYVWRQEIGPFVIEGISIPYMALSGFLLILVLLAADAMRRRTAISTDDQPMENST
ncbi:MAG: disulfide bond formation protein B [Acidimicrobiia bacterium]|nr:disulfide bond formation protein B [Acidimicrobiia bacterium]NNC75873.1 disulfide bond formation protein B [Acidimicrobiia bacterium]